MIASSGGDNCKEMTEVNSKTEVEESEEEEEEPHLTWVNKYDRPMPQVGM